MTRPAPDSPGPAPKAPKAAEIVAAQLRREIVLGQRGEGELLPPELALMADLGVSRPTLRQALRILESERLVRIDRGRNGGARVSRPTVGTAGRYLNNLLLHRGATLDDVHAARLLLEPAAVAEIAGKVGVDDLASLRASVAGSLDDADALRSRRLAAAFHVQLVELTGSRALALFAQLVSGLLDVPAERHDAQRLRLLEPPSAAGLLDDHARIIDLIEAGASRQAARHWRQHLDRVHRRLGETVNTGTPLDLET